MGVAVDEARHDDAAVGVDEGGADRAGTQLGLLADGDDGVALDKDRAVIDVGVCRIARDDAPVANENH